LSYPISLQFIRRERSSCDGYAASIPPAVKPFLLEEFRLTGDLDIAFGSEYFCMEVIKL
jgi:hypothetical protein